MAFGAIGSRTGRAFDKRAGSCLKLSQRSFSSSSLDRISPMVADEDMSTMTIDFLWTRLQAQRGHCKAQKKQAQVLVQKILELEHKLRIEVELRQQAEHGIREAFMSSDGDHIGPPQDLSQSLVVGTSLQEKCQGRHGSSSSSAVALYGYADYDGEEGLNNVHNGHPCACLDKDARIEAISRKMQGWFPEHRATISEEHEMDMAVVQEHDEQDKVDELLHAHEQCQGFEVSSLSKGHLSPAHNDSASLPITNLKQPPGHVIDTTSRKKTCEIVEESASECALDGTCENLAPHDMVGYNHTCKICYNTRAAIRSRGTPSNTCNLSCQKTEIGDLGMASRNSSRHYPIISHRSCDDCRVQVGSSQHVQQSGCSNVAPWPYLFQCKHMGSRQASQAKGNTPKRRELGHSLSLGRVVTPPEYVTSKEFKPADYEPEPVYTMTEVLKMLEFTNHICASNRIPRLKLTDEDAGQFVADGHCQIRSRQARLRRSHGSLRSLVDTTEAQGLL